MTEEEWKPVFGWEGYEMNFKGEVRSKDRIITKCNGVKQPWKGKYLIRQTNYKGRDYFQAVIRMEHKEKYIHQLVWEYYNDRPIPEGYVIHHIDGNPKNNIIENLQLMTKPEHDKYHQNDPIRNNKVSKANTNGKCSKPIIQLTLDGEFVREWKSATEVQRQLGFSQGYICWCCKGKYKTAYGYIWRYKETEATIDITPVPIAS